MAPSSKDAWRTEFRSFRRSLTPEKYRARSSLIEQRALSLPDLTSAQVVHVYWALQERGEIDTRMIITALRGCGAEIVLPVVQSYDPDTPILEHRRYLGPSTLQTNRWGILEPVNTERVAPQALDVVLVPALGADRRGQRIGHGTGYYDAFLESVSCPRIALVYEDCLVPSLPTAPHDVAMTTLVTEHNVLDTRD